MIGSAASGAVSLSIRSSLISGREAMISR